MPGAGPGARRAGPRGPDGPPRRRGEGPPINLAQVYDFSGRITQGARQEWAGAVDDLLQVLEDLVRDATIRATGAGVPLFYEPADEVVDLLASTWPDGITRCSRAILDARDDLEVFVSGKTVIDALMTSLRRELAATPRPSRPA